MSIKGVYTCGSMWASTPTKRRATSFSPKRCRWQMKRGEKKEAARVPSLNEVGTWLPRREQTPDHATAWQHARGHRNSPPDCFSRFARALFEPLPAIIPKTKTPPCRVVFCFWSGRRGSNSLPRPWQGRALPDELRPHVAPTVFGQCHGASGRS